MSAIRTRRFRRICRVSSGSSTRRIRSCSASSTSVCRASSRRVRYGDVLHVLDRECCEALVDRRAARFFVELEGVGPGDDGVLVAAGAHVGEAGQEQGTSVAAAAEVLGDAGGAEEAEGFVVGGVGGEAGDLVVVLEVVEGASVAGFEVPDGAEVFFDEGEHTILVECGGHAAALDSGGKAAALHNQILRLGGLAPELL